MKESVHNKEGVLGLWDKKHCAIVHKARASGWTETAEDVLDCADMLVAYLSRERCRRAGVVGERGKGLQWRGEWKRFPYGQAIRRAMYLLAIRRGQGGKMRLPPNWRERLGEAGVDWETMGVIVGSELKWARAWKQFMEYDSFRIERQREWNVLGVEAEWPPPVIGWEARANSRRVRGVMGDVGGKAGEVVKVGKVDIMSKFRKRVRMRVEEEGVNG